VRKRRHAVPAEPLQWLEEIALAYKDAPEAVPFGELLQQSISDADLFHLAPLVCLKMRGLPLTGAQLDKARDAALASYVAPTERQSDPDADRVLVFAFCYLASHYGLDLIEEPEGQEIMMFVEEHRADLARLIGEGY
jgi:hypothetical protein